MKKALSILLALMLLVLPVLSGCSGGGGGQQQGGETQGVDNDSTYTFKAKDREPEADGKKHLKIACMLPGLDSQFWNANVAYGVQNAALDAAEKYPDWVVDVIVQGPTNEAETDKFINIMENVIASEDLDGMILSTLVADPAGPVVAEAKEKGILVNLYGFPVTTADENWGTIIRTDQAKVGAKAAEAMWETIQEKNLPEDGVVGMFNGVVNSTIELMLNGFRDRLQELGPELTILDVQYNEGDVTKAIAQVETVLSTHGDKIVGLYGGNNISGNAIARVLAESNLSGKMATVSVDADVEQLNSLEKGDMDALAVSRSYSAVYELTELTIDALIGGKEQPKYIRTDPVIFRKADLTDPDFPQMYIGDLWPEKMKR
ncbi:substrate-binding domain-containing protein [Feifania hominis]|uniref:Substrate-binding domain-containing protein n=1 Tax=Feifania hominis TaxID=2763660 RepID=A0A926DCK8_9FIRM|nr:substrate-binding domain-containing protein [Feifania hominis]MBC8535362.1 substrate-binding domain-containing protein [Feifania hominis]